MIAVGIDKNPKNSGAASGTTFGQFQGFTKGVKDCIVNTGSALEAGDIVHNLWKDKNTWWESAVYNGGDINDRANYTPLLEVDLGTNCTVDLPVNAVVSAWSDWSACALDLQTRTRTVITTALHGGTTPALIETRACVSTPLPVNAVVSEWSEWSACSLDLQTRTRTVITPASNGGTTPTLIETRACETLPISIVILKTEFAIQTAIPGTQICDLQTTIPLYGVSTSLVGGSSMIVYNDPNLTIPHNGSNYTWAISYPDGYKTTASIGTDGRLYLGEPCPLPTP